MNSLLDTLNSLRRAAGLSDVARPGASKMAIQLEINRAQQGVFK